MIKYDEFKLNEEVKNNPAILHKDYYKERK